MNHKPFELWILEPDELSEAQRGDLEAHLEGCEACRKLQAGWTILKEELRTPEVAAPRAGFTNRWKAEIAERRAREQRKQAWRLFLSCSGAAALLLVFFVAYVFSTTTPAGWIQVGVRVISSSVGMASAFRDVATTWMQYTPPALNVALWISLAVTFCALTFVWVFAMWRTSLGGAIQK
jgi:anti-sigma factor RsiW